MNQLNNNNRPKMTSAGIEASYPVTVMDESGNKRETHITGERPLTIYVDKQEIVTLMTLGKYPELLVIGYLHNQGFIKQTEELKAVQERNWRLGGKTGETHRDFWMWARHCFWGSDGQFRGNSVTNANFASIHILPPAPEHP